MRYTYEKSFIALIFLCSCVDYENDANFYYATFYPRNILRVAVVEPYELTADRQHVPLEWQINFQTDSIYFQFPVFMNEVGVHKNFIILYTQSGTIQGQPEWFVIDIEKKKERCFLSDIEYKSYINRINASSTILYNIDSVYNNLYETGKYPIGWPRKSVSDTAANVKDLQ